MAIAVMMRRYPLGHHGYRRITMAERSTASERNAPPKPGTPRPQRTEDKRPEDVSVEQHEHHEADDEHEDGESGTIRRGDHGVGGQSE
jgi:hypothetical protein